MATKKTEKVKKEEVKEVKQEILPEVVQPISKPALQTVDDESAEHVWTDEDVKGPEKYYEAVGRRKNASARVFVFTKKSTDKQPAEDRAIITVNNKPYFEYFNNQVLQNLVESPLRKLKSLNRFKATVMVRGGGSTGQADAIKFGLSRALILFDPNFSKKLRKAGFLTRDSRVKERRKYGLKKARKSPQWAKR